MKRVSTLATAGLLGVLVFLNLHDRAVSSERKPVVPERWEYRSMTRAQVQESAKGKSLVAALDILGAEGWELAAVDGLASEAIFEAAMAEKMKEVTNDEERKKLRQVAVSSTFFFKRTR